MTELAEEYDPTVDPEQAEAAEPQRAPQEEETEYILDPADPRWLWAIPTLAILSLLLVILVAIEVVPDITKEFRTLVIAEAVFLGILLILGILTVIER